MVRVYNLRFKAFLLIFALFVVLMAGSVSAANTTCVVSVSSGGNASNNYNAEPVISADGRYVVFSSEATNLVPEDGNSCPDVFIRDTILNTTKRVSVSSTGGDADGGSYTPSISRDGRYVAFVSSATNLVSGDGNGCDDIFVRDMLLGVTTLISHPNGGESDGNSYAPSISGDGRYVAFVSSATNLVSGDGNGCDDVFVFDRTSDSMKRISLAVNGTEANSYSDTPSVSGDGRFIAFVSDASNLVTGDGNGCSDIFLYDQTLNKLLRISTASNGTESDGMSYEPSISGDGRYVAFTSYADNLVSDDTNWRKDIFVFDRISGSLERVSVSSTGQEAVTDSNHPSISADGRYVVFTSGYIRPRVALAAARFSHSYVDSLVPSDVNGFTDVFVRDRVLKTTQIVTMSWNGTGTDADSFNPSVNADGTKMAFGSWADNVVVDDNNGLPDIFLTSISAPLNVTGNLKPVIVRSGDKVTVTANVNNPAFSVKALILQKTYNLTQSNGVWTLQYTVPGVSSGVYVVILTVLDSYGNTGTIDLNFTVDNTPPTVKGSVTPVTLRTGGNLTVKASSDSDTQSVTALILGKTYTLKKQADGTWTVPCTVSSGNGKYNVLLKAVDALGNTGNTTLIFTVNNPVVNPSHGTASTSTLPASSSTKTSLFPVSGSTIKSSSSSGTHGHTTGVSTVKGGSQSTVAGKVVSPVFGGGLFSTKPVSESVFSYYY